MDFGLTEDQLLLKETVRRFLDTEGRGRYDLDHERSGEIVALSDPDAWFAYPFWLDDTQAPDYARTVDIHRKPGYDPVNYFFYSHGLLTGF